MKSKSTTRTVSELTALLVQKEIIIENLKNNKKKDNGIFVSFNAVIISFLLALAGTYFYSTLKIGSVDSIRNEQKNVNLWKVLDFRKSDLYSKEEKTSEANRLFNKAASFSGEKGEGRQGWLHLLAAYSYNNQNLDIATNLVSNYEALKYGLIGYTTLLESNLSKSERDSILIPKRQRQLQKDLNIATNSMNLTLDPGLGNTTLMFTSAVSRWNVESLMPARMNMEIYNHSVNEYEKLKAKRPELSATDLNHAFFRVQMAALDTSSSYWGPFKDIDGFPELVATMRRCVSTFLREYHGWGAEDADRKASHPLVVWVSVHTAESVHQPHVTEDALVGGVYYVSVPDGSGKLHMYDPRGKHPLHDLKIPTSPPNPPFHRIVSLAPAESLLVLFPGWLVHSVGAASVSEFAPQVRADQTVKYRVSLSLNLKGEWGDTAGAAFGVPTYAD